MNTPSRALLCALLFAACSHTFAQPTAFTYQGRLNDASGPANGTYDFWFALKSAPTGGNTFGVFPAADDVGVTNGLFTVALDFTAVPFDGSAQWLEIHVRTNGNGVFTMLSPRQQLSATPYAIRAANFSGQVAASQLTGTIASSNLATGSVTADKVDPALGLWTRSGSNIFYLAGGVGINNNNPNGAALAVGGAVNVEGVVSANALSAGSVTTPQFGTFGNQLQFDLNYQRALRLEYSSDDVLGYSPNLIGGFSGNAVTNGPSGPFAGPVIGATIGGGGSQGAPNRAENNFATVVGGVGNLASGLASTAMGHYTKARGSTSTSMGSYTEATAPASTAMGAFTTASGGASMAAGTHAKANHEGTFVWADTSTFTDFASTTNDQFLIRARGGVGIGTTIAPLRPLDVKGVIGLQDAGGRTLNAGLGSEAGAALLNLGINDGSVNRFGGASTVGIQGGFLRLDTRAGQPLFGFFGRSAQVNGDAAKVASISSDGAARFELGIGRTFSLGGRGAFEIDAPGAAGGRFVVTDGGNVGIGKSAPGGRLDVLGGTAGNAIQGTCNDGTASGVYGENLTGGGYGLAGRATGAGWAVLGDNNNSTGWAGYFNGNVRVTGTINPPSDRNVKRDFEAVDSRDVLEKVAALSIQTWAYTNDSRGTRHLGPVAQDFQAAFGLGADDKSIATVDADGVALAAIKGLNQKLEERLKVKDEEINKLKSSIEELRRMVFNAVQK